MAVERIYTIPLRKAFSKAPDYRRTERAVNELRRFIAHHMKCVNVKIGKYLNLEMWERGRKNPPPRIQVKVLKDKKKVKDKEVEFVLAELIDKEFDMPKKDVKGKKGKETKAEEKHVHTESDKEHKEEAAEIEKEEIKLEKKELQKEEVQVEPAESKPKAEGKLRQEEAFPRSQKPVHEKGK